MSDQTCESKIEINPALKRFREQEEIYRKNYTAIPNIIVDNVLGLSFFTKALMEYLIRQADKFDSCYQSTATISKNMGISVGTISKSRKELAELELITITEKPSGRGKPLCDVVLGDVWLLNHYYNQYTKDERTQIALEFSSIHGMKDKLHHMNNKLHAMKVIGSSHEMIKESIKEKRINKKNLTAVPAESVDTSTNKKQSPCVFSFEGEDYVIPETVLTSKKKGAGAKSTAGPYYHDEAVQIYRGITRLTPNLIQQEKIHEEVHDLNLWKSTVEWFMVDGKDKTKVGWMIDSYKKGGKEKVIAGYIEAKRNGNGHQPEHERIAAEDY